LFVEFAQGERFAMTHTPLSKGMHSLTVRVHPISGEMTEDPLEDAELKSFADSRPRGDLREAERYGIAR
jgi:hypothetical protein